MVPKAACKITMTGFHDSRFNHTIKPNAATELINQKFVAYERDEYPNCQPNQRVSALISQLDATGRGGD